MGVSKAADIEYYSWLYAGIVSFACSSLIVLTHVRFRKLRTLYFKLTLFLSLSDMLVAASWWPAMKYNTSLTTCAIQEYMFVFGFMSSACWIAVISQTLLQLVNGRCLPETKTVICYSLAAILVPVGGVAVLYHFETYKLFCGSKNRMHFSYEQSYGAFLGVALGVLYLCSFYGLYVYLYVGMKFKNSADVGTGASAAGPGTVTSTDGQASAEHTGGGNKRHEVLHTFISGLKYYPIALAFCWSWGVASTIYNLATHQNPPVAYDVVNVAMASSNGVINTIIFFVRNSRVRSSWQHDFMRLKIWLNCSSHSNLPSPIQTSTLDLSRPIPSPKDSQSRSSHSHNRSSLQHSATRWASYVDPEDVLKSQTASQLALATTRVRSATGSSPPSDDSRPSFWQRMSLSGSVSSSPSVRLSHSLTTAGMQASSR